MAYEKGTFRPGLAFEEDVSVTLPAWVWISFAAAFSSCEWDSPYAREIVNASHKEILSPRFLSEQEAQMQMQRDQQEAMLKRMTGQGDDSPGFPPFFGGPSA